MKSLASVHGLYRALGKGWTPYLNKRAVHWSFYPGCVTHRGDQGAGGFRVMLNVSGMREGMRKEVHEAEMPGEMALGG